MWAKIPKKGYVGAGFILESMKDFKVQAENGEQPALMVLSNPPACA